MRASVRIFLDELANLPAHSINLLAAAGDMPKKLLHPVRFT